MKKTLNAFGVLYIFSFVLLLIPRQFSFLSSEIFDRDGYVSLYEDYLKLGFYDSVAKGTTVLFNLWNSVLNFFIADLSILFKVTNYVSILVIGYLASKILNSKKLEIDKSIAVFFSIMYCLLWIDSSQLTWSNNDVFLTVLIMLIYEVLFTKDCTKLYYNIFIGCVLGLMFCTRAFTIILTPVLVLLFMNNNFSFKNYLILIASLIIVIVCFNIPSILEYGKLSFYDKNSEFYKVVNTLGTLEMFRENNINWTMKGIYNQSWDEYKINYLIDKYSITEFPSNGIEFMIKYPVEYFKLLLLNTFYVLKLLFRRYALLIILPIVPFFMKKDLIDKGAIKHILFFIVALFSLLSILNCVVEYRWLNTFEFLLIIAIAKSIIFKDENSKIVNLNYWIIISSLLILTLFNLRSFINYL